MMMSHTTSIENANQPTNFAHTRAGQSTETNRALAGVGKFPQTYPPSFWAVFARIVCEFIEHLTSIWGQIPSFFGANTFEASAAKTTTFFVFSNACETRLARRAANMNLARIPG